MDQDTPDQHGFILCGLDTIFGYHLGMLGMRNHKFQFIVELLLTASAYRMYIDDRLVYPSLPYILGNVRTDLFTIPEIQTKSRGTFVGDLFRGVPGDPNSDLPLLPSILVSISRVVHYRPIYEGTEYTPTFSYLMFGAGREAHIAHFLSRTPDFDDVWSLGQAPKWLSSQRLRAGVRLNFPDSRWSGPPYESSPLRGGPHFVQHEAEPDRYEVTLDRNIWFDAVGINA